MIHENKLQQFAYKERIWNSCLQNVGHFIQTSKCKQIKTHILEKETE